MTQQLKALIFKSWKQTVRQKMALLVQVLSPIMALLIILAMKSAADHLVNNGILKWAFGTTYVSTSGILSGALNTHEYLNEQDNEFPNWEKVWGKNDETIPDHSVSINFFEESQDFVGQYQQASTSRNFFQIWIENDPEWDNDDVSAKFQGQISDTDITPTENENTCYQNFSDSTELETIEKSVCKNPKQNQKPKPNEYDNRLLLGKISVNRTGQISSIQLNDGLNLSGYFKVDENKNFCAFLSSTKFTNKKYCVTTTTLPLKVPPFTPNITINDTTPSGFGIYYNQYAAMGYVTNSENEECFYLGFYQVDRPFSVEDPNFFKKLAYPKILKAKLFGDKESCQSSHIVGGITLYTPYFNVFSYKISNNEKVVDQIDFDKYISNSIFAEDCRTDIAYGIQDNNTALIEKVNNQFLQKLPWLYQTFCTDKEFNKVTPYFQQSNFTNLTEMESEIVETIKRISAIDDSEKLDDSNDFLKSAYFLIKDLDKTKIQSHLTMNNVQDGRYHRRNGFESGVKYFGYPELPTPTEGMITLLNWLTNMHLNYAFPNPNASIFDQGNIVISLASPQIQGKSTSAMFIESFQYVIQAGIFPQAMAMGFPIMVYIQVIEKEENIKELLEINGMKAINYWIVYIGYYFTIANIVSIIFIIAGRLMIDMTYYRTTSMMAEFLQLIVWNFSQTAMALFITSFQKNSKVAQVVGYLISIFGILVLGVINTYLFPFPNKLPFFFYILPQCAIIRAYYVMNYMCSTGRCVLSLSEMPHELIACMCYMFGASLIFMIVGLLVNEPSGQRFVIKIQNKVKCCFCGKRSGKKVNSREPNCPENIDNLSVDEFEGDSSGVGNSFQDNTINNSVSSFMERSAIDNMSKINEIEIDNHKKYYLIAKDLHKTYKEKTDKKALDSLYLSTEKGQILGLLGPNGAGKTTFLKILTGIEKPDQGVAYIKGINVTSSNRNRGIVNIGFCPQFDILWPTLTCEDHQRFFCMFKDVPKNEISKVVTSLQTVLDLENDKNKLAKELSGGMKRRLSLGISLIGDPDIIFLDEPTSGLDLVKRRSFWDLINKISKNKSIILTTHLMEEADTLSDQIAIITEGTIRCIGTPSRLKNLYGHGYELQVVLEKAMCTSPLVKKLCEKAVFKQQKKELKNRIKGINEYFQENIKGLQVVDTVDNVIKYIITTTKNPLSDVEDETETVQLGEVFRVLKQNELVFGIKDWSIKQGSLEDVFINIVKKYRVNNEEGDNLQDQSVSTKTNDSFVGDNFDQKDDIQESEKDFKILEDVIEENKL